MYIDIETLVTAIYFVVNNWYLREGHCYLDGKVGRKPIFTDSELLTTRYAINLVKLRSLILVHLLLLTLIR
jgi:hypothetical protein